MRTRPPKTVVLIILSPLGAWLGCNQILGNTSYEAAGTTGAGGAQASTTATVASSAHAVTTTSTGNNGMGGFGGLSSASTAAGLGGQPATSAAPVQTAASSGPSSGSTSSGACGASSQACISCYSNGGPCAPQFTACQADPACFGAAGDIGMCICMSGDTPPTVQPCIERFDAGDTATTEVYDCLAKHCAAECFSP